MKTISFYLNDEGLIEAIRVTDAAGVAEALPPESELAEVLGEVAAAAISTTTASAAEKAELQSQLDTVKAELTDTQAQLEDASTALAASLAADPVDLKTEILEQLRAELGVKTTASWWSRIFGA